MIEIKADSIYFCKSKKTWKLVDSESRKFICIANKGIIGKYDIKDHPKFVKKLLKSGYKLTTQSPKGFNVINAVHVQTFDPHLVMYARMVYDKNDGSLMTGVYFGGIGASKDEADIIAAKCVKETKSGVCMPKVHKITDKGIQQTVQILVDQFEKLAANIYETERTLKR